jgi:2-(1,2-epoxy-1,2-dihydrophenyl)acetyl-CoA isomerase
MNDAVLLSREGPVATITLNRPAALNALDAAMIRGLAAATSDVAGDPSARVVVLRGAGRHFMVGGDIREFDRHLSEPGPERRVRFQRFVEDVHAAIETLFRIDKPVIGVVQGAVAGIGLSLMNACDLVVAAEDACFVSAYRQIALSPDGGGSYSLPRLVGVRHAMEILLLSERFDANRARELGLVNRVVPLDALHATVAAIAADLAQAPARSVAHAKRLVRMSFERTLSEQLQAEAVSFGECAGTDDFVEGIRAFLDKRPPRFA